MHDQFSSRSDQFRALGIKDSAASLTVEQECANLALAQAIIAIQGDEAAFVRQHLPSHRVIVARKAASPVTSAQPGRDELVLFVGSSAAANIDGVQWFLSRCWPGIRARKPSAKFLVAGSVCDLLGSPPSGVEFLGFVEDLTSLYREAGVVVAPLRVGSGLKNGVRVEEDASGFASAVVHLLNDRGSRVELASRAIGELLKYFSREECYGEFVEFVAGVTRSEAPAKNALLF
jgi:succinoglycan biosynthesis protein ExoO